MAVEQIILDIRAQVADAKKKLGQLEKQVGGVNKQVEKTNKLFDKAATAIGTFFAAQKIIQWGKDVGKVIMDFQTQISGLSAITGAVGKDLDFMRERAIELSVELKKSAKDIVEAFQLVGSAKPDLLKNAEALAEVTRQAIILSKAARIDVTEAANIVTKALNMWGAGAKEAAKFTDILADSQKKGTAVVQQIGDALKNAGSIAASVGMTFEATNATLQAFAKGGLDGLKAGMGFNIVIRKLAQQLDDDFNPALLSMTEVLDNLAEEGFGDLRKATKLVGEEGARYLLTLIQQRDVVRELEFDLGEAGVAMDQFKTNTDNMRGALDELKASWDALILSIESGEGAIATAAELAVNAVSSILQMTTAKSKAAGGAFKTLGPMFKYLFSRDEGEKQEALEDARIGGLKIGLAIAEATRKVSDFFGIEKGIFGVTEESLEGLRTNVKIAEEAQKAGEDIGEEVVIGIKTGLEALTPEEFASLLSVVRGEGILEEEEIDMGVIEAALTAGKGYDSEVSEARIALDKAVDEFDNAMRLKTQILEGHLDEEVFLQEQASEKELLIEELKQTAKAQLISAGFSFARSALIDNTFLQKLLSIAQALFSTYLTAQLQAQALAPLGPAAAEAARAEGIVAGLANVSLIQGIGIALTPFFEGGFTGKAQSRIKDQHGPIAGLVHEDEFVFNKEKTAQLRPLFDDIHEGRIDARGLAALTKRGVIMPLIQNDFNSEILEREVGRIYSKMQEKEPERWIQKTDRGYIKKIGNTIYNVKS